MVVAGVGDRRYLSLLQDWATGGISVIFFGVLSPDNYPERCSPSLCDKRFNFLLKHYWKSSWR